MQTSISRPIFKLTRFTKDFIRKVSVTSNSVNSDDNIKPWKEIPGPSSMPLIGQLHHFLPGGELCNFGEMGGLQKLFDKYGPLVRFEGSFGVGTMVFIRDPEISAHVLRSENSMPLRPGFVTLEHYRKVYKRSKGNNNRITGLMSDHGEIWKEFRSTVNPVMLQPKTIKLYCSVLDEVALDMIKRMKANRDEQNRIRGNLDIEMNLWALESIGTVALGCRLNCLDSTLPEDSPEKQLIQCIHDLFTIVSQLDFSPNLWKYFPTPQFKKAMKLYELHERNTKDDSYTYLTAFSLTKHFLKKGIEQLKQNAGQKSEHEKGVLEKLLEINEEIAYIMASDMLFAGVDTSANSVIGMLYLLAKNQDKQDKLREELLSNSGKRPYLKACLKENLRMMPVVSGNLRKTTKEYNLLGYRIPKDMNLIFAHRDMSLMNEHFPRANEYIPERWIVEKTDPLYYGNAHPFAHAPFGFGTRSCIGRRIAELEMEIFLARLIENFKVEWEGPPPILVQTSINYVKGPFHFIFTDVK